ncbi:MAG: cytochrome-c oxidase, cbb3-type subunit III [Pseudomonadota bacterium]
MGEISSWFITIGTLGSLVAFALILHLNRKTGHQPGEATGHEYDGITELDNPLPAWWYWGFLLSILFAVGYLVYYPGLGSWQGLGGWTQHNQLSQHQAVAEARYGPLFEQYLDDSLDELSRNPKAVKVGRRLYINNCATCHGATGEGSFGFPNLTDAEWQWGGSDEAIATTIAQGRNGLMIPFADILNRDQIVATVDYVVSLSDPSPQIDDTPTEGATTFALYCASCHGADGTGNPAIGAPDLTNDIWLYGGSRTWIEHIIKNGRNAQMPAFADRLGEARIHILAGYVRSLGGRKAGVAGKTGATGDID